MFGKIAGFEFRYQLRNPVFWVAVGLFLLLTFGAATSDNIQIGSAGNVHKNSPYAVAETELVLSLFFLFVSTAFVANVVVRDDETGFAPIIRATRVRKFDYLFGRFLGAFAAVALAFLAVPLAVLVGSLMPWVDPEKLGPFRIGDYLYNYLLIVLPALFIPAAAFFALATATRSLMATYVGAVAALALFFVGTALGQKPEYMRTTALIDPFGLSGVDYMTRYWTAAERNTRLIPFSDEFLWNRLIWLGIAVAFLAVAYRIFSFEIRSKRVRKRERLALAAAIPIALPAPGAFTHARPRFDGQAGRTQLWARTRFDMSQVFKSPAFFVLLALGVLNSGAGLWFQDAFDGADLYPVTRLMIIVLEGSFSLIPVIVAVYYAGELVWRESDRRTEEIIDSTPAPDWVFVAPKILAIALVFLALLAVSVVTALLVQLFKGYTEFELWKYVAWYLAPLTVSFTLFAVLAIFIQTLSPHKFVGWGITVLFIVLQLVARNLGYEHNLYRYGGGLAGPVVPFSDMNGIGVAGEASWWFRAYWSAIALALVVLTYALWRRGKQSGLRARLRRLPRRLAGPAGGTLVVALGAAAAMGGFIYVNTNLWNVYHTARGDERWQADMEKTLLPFETLTQPKITDVTLNVAIYPSELRAVTDGSYLVKNESDAAIPELHLRFSRWAEITKLDVEGAHQKTAYDQFNYRIYAFDTPLAPGETRKVSFETLEQQKGFSNTPNVNNIRVYANGTFFDSLDLTPTIGMDRNGLLKDRAKRRQLGLPAELRPPKLEDNAALQYSEFIHDANWVNADITVSTDADQIPMAPGYQQSDEVANGRHTTRFVTDAPILNFFSIQSARYTVRKETYKGVDLAVYYDAAHPWNVQRMLDALKVGLDYDQKNFSAFQFKQMRILEFSDYAQFAQSFANTVPYSEGIGFVLDTRDASKLDMITYVTAHELGHQWWAHQAVGADMQGSTMLTETLAQYSAIMAMEQLCGHDQIRKFLKYELDSYLKNRGGEVVEELPLNRVENQGYIHYRKGSVVMYRLKDVIGEDAVNRALHRYLELHAFKGPPYPRSTELIDLFRQEAGDDPGRQALITDLFEKITVYDLHAVKAESHKRADGKYDVSLEITAKKNYADGLGKETEAAMDEPVDIGLFTRKPGKADFTSKDVVLLKRVAVHSGSETFNFVTDAEPSFAGLDPYNTMINRNSEENIVSVGG